MQLTVYFNGQYWVGLVECTYEDGFHVARHIFGPEPGDIEVFEYTVREMGVELAQSQAVPTKEDAVHSFEMRYNPKRAAREAAKQMRKPIVSAEAQDAMRQQAETLKQSRQQQAKAEREAEAAHKRALIEAKVKQKRRGH